MSTRVLGVQVRTRPTRDGLDAVLLRGLLTLLLCSGLKCDMKSDACWDY